MPTDPEQSGEASLNTRHVILAVDEDWTLDGFLFPHAANILQDFHQSWQLQHTTVHEN